MNLLIPLFGIKDLLIDVWDLFQFFLYIFAVSFLGLILYAYISGRWWWSDNKAEKKSQKRKFTERCPN